MTDEIDPEIDAAYIASLNKNLAPSESRSPATGIKETDRAIADTKAKIEELRGKRERDPYGYGYTARITEFERLLAAQSQHRVTLEQRRRADLPLGDSDEYRPNSGSFWRNDQQG